MQARPIPDFPAYSATVEGKIVNTKTGRTLKTWRAGGTNKDYDYVQLGRDGIKTGAHRLVCMAFHGLPPTLKHEAAHKDGNTSNNRPDNLSWKTRKQNEADKHLHGTARRPVFHCAEHPCAKLTEAAADDIRRRQGPTMALAKEYGVDRSTIRRIVRGDAWQGPKQTQQQ